jgi:Spy/CpxP family protein refolding chaperone
MLRIIKAAVVTLAVGMFMVSGAYAGQVGCAPEGKGDMTKKMAKELNLTADQQAKLEANKAARYEKMKTLREAMKANRDKFREEMKKPDVARAGIEPIVSEMKSLQGQMIDQRVDGIFEVKGILTPEQFEKFQKKAEEKEAKFGERAKKWHDKK